MCKVVVYMLTFVYDVMYEYQSVLANGISSLAVFTGIGGNTISLLYQSSQIWLTSSANSQSFSSFSYLIFAAALLFTSCLFSFWCKLFPVLTYRNDFIRLHAITISQKIGLQFSVRSIRTWKILEHILLKTCWMFLFPPPSKFFT